MQSAQKPQLFRHMANHPQIFDLIGVAKGTGKNEVSDR